MWENSECEKLLGVKFDNKVTFEKHITDIYRKASRKKYALARVASYMDLSKWRLVMNVFSIRSSIIVHFSGCVTIARQIEK